MPVLGFPSGSEKDTGCVQDEQLTHVMVLFAGKGEMDLRTPIIVTPIQLSALNTWSY